MLKGLGDKIKELAKSDYAVKQSLTENKEIGRKKAGAIYLNTKKSPNGTQPMESNSPRLVKRTKSVIILITV